MVINGPGVAVDATAVAAAYEIYLDGRYRKLTAASAPHCP
jgi:hypothetical protein